MELNLVQSDNPILKEPCKQLYEFNKQYLENLRDVMFQMMKLTNGVGLAANQVGINQAIFVANIDIIVEDKNNNKYVYSKPNIFINPTIISKDYKKREKREGCLSKPNFYPKVERSKEISVRFQAIDGEPFEVKLTDDAARIFQHELDHLNGITIF